MLAHAKSFILEVAGKDGRETAELVVALDSWKKARRFIVEPVRKDASQTAQLSFLPGEEFEYYFFVTNTDLPVEAVVVFYEKRGNA